jgi:diaminohydroxyphosphoribosylaminopyrimidine deaminase/5-amino-6-(5-phosphoribosylamino)uracil reductase
VQYLLVEGGAAAAAAFLDAGRVDRILLYRAPVEFGDGLPAFRNGLPDGWQTIDRRRLGDDTLEIYEQAG